MFLCWVFLRPVPPEPGVAAVGFGRSAAGRDAREANLPMAHPYAANLLSQIVFLDSPDAGGILRAIDL